MHNSSFIAKSSHTSKFSKTYAHSKYAQKLLLRKLSMRKSCCCAYLVCAEAAAAHSEYAWKHPQPPQFWLNKTFFGKKHPFYYGE